MFGELEPWLRPWAIWILLVADWYRTHPFYKNTAMAKGGDFLVTSVYRSRRQQEALYRDYLSGRSKIPAAPPGQSAHEYRVAFDLARTRDPFHDDLLHQLGHHWTEAGGIYGRHNFDPVHFQGRSVGALRA